MKGFFNKGVFSNDLYQRKLINSIPLSWGNLLWEIDFLILILFWIKLYNLTSQNLWIEKNCGDNYSSSFLLARCFPPGLTASPRSSMILFSHSSPPHLTMILPSVCCWCEFGILKNTWLDETFLQSWSERLLRHRCSWRLCAACKCLIADRYLLWRWCVLTEILLIEVR